MSSTTFLALIFSLEILVYYCFFSYIVSSRVASFLGNLFVFSISTFSLLHSS
jgi:hypothetical protein